MNWLNQQYFTEFLKQNASMNCFLETIHDFVYPNLDFVCSSEFLCLILFGEMEHISVQIMMRLLKVPHVLEYLGQMFSELTLTRFLPLSVCFK